MHPAVAVDLGRHQAWPSDEHVVFRTADPDDARRRAQSMMARHRMEVDASAGHFSAVVHRARLGRLDLLNFAYGAPTHISSAPLNGFVTVHVPRRGTLQVAQNGHSALVPPGSAAVISAGSPVELIWGAELDLLVLKMPEAVLDQQLADLTGRSGEPLSFELLHSLDGGSALAAGLALALRAVQGSSEVGGALAAAVTQSVVTGLLLGHRHDRSGDIWSASPVPRGLVRYVADAVREAPAEEHTTHRLAQRLGVSERTLQLVFARDTGMSPSSYVRRLRVELAREQLLAGGAGGTSVLDVALACGLGHAGRFAAAYRERFGETPSETRGRVGR